VAPLKERPAAVPRRRSDGGIEAVPTLQGGLGRRMVGEHLNEATISRLGSILECGNMTSFPYDVSAFFCVLQSRGCNGEYLR
jgi:hypothetical protein